MKLKTMLLPTGEFLLIGENVKYNDHIPQAMADLKEAAGAAGFFVTDADVEVEDAQFNPDAVRRQPDDVRLSDVDETNYFSRTYLPNVEFDLPSFEVDGDGMASLTGKAVSSGWTDLGSMSKDAMDPESLKTIFGVDITREYGPAGQIKGQPGDPDFLASEAFQQGTEPRVETPLPSNEVLIGTIEDFGKVIDQPARELYDLVTGANGVTTVTPKKYAPQPGDHVRIVTVNGWEEKPSDNAYTGREGKIVGPYGSPERELWLVDINEKAPHIACSKLELIAPASLDEVR